MIKYVGDDVEERESLCTLDENVNGYHYYRMLHGCPQKIKNRTI